jgi:hypothetical protein
VRPHVEPQGVAVAQALARGMCSGAQYECEVASPCGQQLGGRLQIQGIGSQLHAALLRSCLHDGMARSKRPFSGLDAAHHAWPTLACSVARFLHVRRRSPLRALPDFGGGVERAWLSVWPARRNLIGWPAVQRVLNVSATLWQCIRGRLTLNSSSPFSAIIA